MFIQVVIICLVILIPLNGMLCSNILLISPLASPSHYLWNKALSMGLIEQKHNITMLSHASEAESIANFTVITMEGLYDILQNNFRMEEFADTSTLMAIKGTYEYGPFVCEHDIHTKGLAQLLNYPENFRFDLIIYDVTIIQCLYPLIARFGNPPVVGVTAFLLPPLLSHAFGNHLHTSYMPFYSTSFSRRMNIAERTLNFIYTYTDMFVRNYIYSPVEFEIAKKRFGENITPFEEIERNMSLLLTNTDHVFHHPIALPPNIIPVGGLHLKPATNLSGDLQKLMDNADRGVILFALGSNVKSVDLKLEFKKILLSVFAKLPQLVIWKLEMDGMKGLPKNVVIRKWLPQNDILGHPNTRLFISHGGALSTQEAMYHGVPVIGIPFFGDQYVNTQQMKDREVGEHLDITQKLTAEHVYEKIKSVLDSKKYTENMRKISKLYRDQPQTALERAIFWIEYVLRHGNAEHLVLSARDMPRYQTSNVDVLAVLLLVIILMYSTIMLIFTCCRFYYYYLANSIVKSRIA